MSAQEHDDHPSLQYRVEHLGVSLGIIALAALTSPISHQTLAPVYGSFSASINHQTALPISFLSGFILHGFLLTRPSLKHIIIQSLPLVAVLAPPLGNVAVAFSKQLGVVAGPALGAFISCYAIVILAAVAAAESLDKVRIGRFSNSVSSYANGSIALLPLFLLERFFTDQLGDVISQSQLLAPADLQLIIAGGFCLLINPVEILLLIVGLLAISTWLFNPHGKGLYADRVLNGMLDRHGWTLLARTWSTTGYISVLESKTEAYRVLRCDHSLLGGNWLLNAERQATGVKVEEPIYSVFAMLEAVRLLEIDHVVADNDAKALVIGLGIGNAPAAFIRHGIATTIVELDPVVHQFATQFFSLPTNHTKVIADAVSWVHSQTQKDTFDIPSYDYIIHDVFTGGAEPLPLFTKRFIQNLRSLLTPNGVAAINYAGDLNDPLTALVLNTIDTVFNRQCAIYSDDPTQDTDKQASTFSNLVVFCRNTPGGITFRKPSNADFQGSLIRRDHLLPKPQQRVDFPLRVRQTSSEPHVVEATNLRRWRRAQIDSARWHWQVMRTVLPSRVWESY